MNSYELSRSWFDWSFENPEKIRPIHTAIYFFAIEHSNRLGWKEKFGFPSQMVMDAIGVKKFQTYGKALHELSDWGFIEFIEKSKNQYSANIIRFATPKKGKAQDKALDKAFIKHRAKQPFCPTKKGQSIGQGTGHSTGHGMDSINKQINKEQERGENPRALDFLKKNYPQRLESDFKMKFNKLIKDKKGFSEAFNDKVDVEDLEYTDRILFARLNNFANRWVDIQNKTENSSQKQKSKYDGMP